MISPHFIETGPVVTILPAERASMCGRNRFLVRYLDMLLLGRAFGASTICAPRECLRLLLVYMMVLPVVFPGLSWWSILVSDVHLGENRANLPEGLCPMRH